jgi:hypothetical protein
MSNFFKINSPTILKLIVRIYHYLHYQHILLTRVPRRNFKKRPDIGYMYKILKKKDSQFHSTASYDALSPWKYYTC